MLDQGLLKGLLLVVHSLTYPVLSTRYAAVSCNLAHLAPNIPSQPEK